MDFEVDVAMLAGFDGLDDMQPPTTWTAIDEVRAPPLNGQHNLAPAELSPTGFSELTSSSSGPASAGLGDEGTVSQICGLSGDMDPYVLQQYRFDPVTNSLAFKRLAVRSVASSPNPVQFLVSLQTGSERSDTLQSARRAELDAIVSREIGQRLVALYYRFIFPQIPIFHTHAKVDACTSPPHVLAAIYFLAQAFSSFDDHLCIQTVYEDPPLESLKKIALDAINDSVSSPTISHLESALLLLLAPAEDPVRPDYCGRWALLGVVVSMGQSLGFDHDPGAWDLPSEDIGLRRRLSWLVRYADTWLAAALGRSPLISSHNWAVKVPTPLDFEVGEGSKHSAVLFRRLIDLTLILAAVLESLYSLNVVDALSSDFRSTLGIAQTRMTDLIQWFQSIDLASCEDEASLDVNSNGVLQLGYHAVKLWILRAAMRPIEVSRLQAGTTQLIDYDSAVQEGSRRLRSAASGAVNEFTAFTATLDSGRLHAFWPFWTGLAWSSMGQLCTLLLVSASDVEDAKRQKAALDRTRQVLRLRSRSLAALKFPLLRLDSMHWKGFDNCFNLSPQVREALYA